MNRVEFIATAEELMHRCFATLQSKGKDYAGKEDALANFKRNAEQLGLSKYQVWRVYIAKHLDAITNSIKANPNDPQVESEPLEDRLMDVINYCLLFQGMLVEDAKPENGEA